MHRIAHRLFLGPILVVAWCAPADADGGSLVLSATRAGYQLSVFTAPVPLRAGPVDISVLVQDSVTRAPVPDVGVTVRVTRPGHPVLEYAATTEAATNKLFRSAQFMLPDAGRWDLEIQVVGERGTAAIRCEVEAAQRLPRWREVWPWVGWPVVVIGLFVVHLWRARDAKPSRVRTLDPKPRGP
jgi:hypothetical protein